MCFNYALLHKTRYIFGVDLKKNKLKQVRESLLISKSELARNAGLSPITVDRVEKGMDCRMDTKRKIINALGLKLSDAATVFSDD